MERLKLNELGYQFVEEPTSHSPLKLSLILERRALIMLEDECLLLQGLFWILLKRFAPLIPLPCRFTHRRLQIVLHFLDFELLVFPVLGLATCLARAPSNRLQHLRLRRRRHIIALK